METQSLQSNKNSKITVPFYSPPSRLYGQTPAEIIKEARAAVMNTPVIGIKPVFTSRPFTPKEKERVLFGNVKKKTARPPSAFSLSYLQKQEAVPRIKLPSIGVAPKKKQNRGSNFRTTFSLDNLTEEYEAEILEEKMRESNLENLPSFRKSYSCPQERHLIRAVSCTERLSFSDMDDYRQWIGAGDYGENVPPLPTSDSYSSFSSDRYSDDSYDLPRHTVSAGRDRHEELNRWSSDELPKNHSHNVAWKSSERHGAGDYDLPRYAEKTTLVKKTHHLSEPLHTIDDQNIGDGVKTTKKESRKLNSKKKKQTQEVTVKTETDEISNSIEEKYETIPVENETENSKEIKSPDVEMTFEENQSTVDDIVSQISKEMEDSKMETITEKSVETNMKSDYLTMESQGVKASVEEITPAAKPREILELYETARYYGVVLDESKNIVSSTTPANTQEEKPKVVEDVFGEKELESQPKPVNPNDYLENLRINFKHIDEKMKKLNGSIENFEKKLVAKGNHSTRAVKDNAINEAKVTGNRKILSDKEFVMNSNKRYHVSNRNSENGEKAYKKWANKETPNKPTDKQYSRDGGWDFFWKNTYFRTKEDLENNSGDKSKEDSALEYLQDMVDRLNGFIKVGCEDQEITDTTNQLYKAMKSGGYFGSNTLENKFKAKILRNLYQFADSENGEVLLCLARIIFALRVESSLSAACKMVFKVARSDVNDHLFIEMEDILELFLEGIGRASPLDAAESVIYGYGALKFLTMNHSILSRALHLGAMDLMTLHMKMINTATMEDSNVGEQTQHALFQLTGALRHIAAGDGALPLFVTTNCIPIMCKTLLLFRRDEDLVTNISRTLSLLSTDEDITQVLMNVENILSVIIDLIDQYKNNDKILIRLSYCLGNIVAHSDLARVQLSRNENSLRILLGVLKLYIDKDLELSMKERSEEINDELDPEIVDDVIVKVIRIVANMSMNPVVGSNLSPATNEKSSLQLSQLLSTLLLRKDPGITLLATLGCLNNISYYCNTHSTLVDITQGVERVLGLSSEECQAEAARVLGNLTRHKEIRDLLFNTGGVEKLSKLLLSQDREVVRCACGALVNMMLDVETRKQFVENQGIDKLIQAFEFFSDDWSLAGLVCRAIWNSCAEDVSSAMMHNNMEHLLNTLANSLEEENWNDGDVVWEEFATIATDLLERINAHLEST